MQTNTRALNLWAISSSINGDNMFVSTTSKSLRTTYKIGEIASLPSVKWYVFKVSSTHPGDSCCRYKVRTLVYQAMNLYWVLLCSLPRAAKVYWHLPRKLSYKILYYGYFKYKKAQSFCPKLRLRTICVKYIYTHDVIQSLVQWKIMKETLCCFLIVLYV